MPLSSLDIPRQPYSNLNSGIVAKFKQQFFYRGHRTKNLCIFILLRVNRHFQSFYKEHVKPNFSKIWILFSGHFSKKNIPLSLLETSIALAKHSSRRVHEYVSEVRTIFDLFLSEVTYRLVLVLFLLVIDAELNSLSNDIRFNRNHRQRKRVFLHIPLFY